MARSQEENRIYMQEYLKRPGKREERQKYMRNRRDKMLDEVFRIYGDRCVCCGETNKKFLTVDHINGGGSRDRHANKGVKFYTRIAEEADRTKYQILCYNCNCGRARNKGVCPHKEKNQK